MMAMIGRESERQQESEGREVHLGRSVEEARSSAVDEGIRSLLTYAHPFVGDWAGNACVPRSK